MNEIKIDGDLCKKDGLCAMACPRGIILQEEKDTIPKIVDAFLENCFLCGQCASICPHGAISHSHFPEGTINPIQAESVPSYDQVLELVRSRRSKRLFKEKAVEREVIEKVLEAARFAPSGHNQQTTEFIVIQDKEIIHKIASITAKCLDKQAKQYQNPVAKTIMRLTMGRRTAEYLSELGPELAGLVSIFNSGKDWILRNAPVLMLFCSDSLGGFMARTNANLALQNAALAAETLGLGCFYVGFIIIAGNRDNSIERLLSLPKTHKIYGALAMGYPRLKFNRWPERNQAKVTWMGAD